MTIDEYLAYYDATNEALAEVSPKLIFGGPGGSCRLSLKINYFSSGGLIF